MTNWIKVNGLTADTLNFAPCNECSHQTIARHVFWEGQGLEEGLRGLGFRAPGQM